MHSTIVNTEGDQQKTIKLPADPKGNTKMLPENSQIYSQLSFEDDASKT